MVTRFDAGGIYKMTSYRKDIDGLRAIAVMIVVLYHCGFARSVHGGFIGVDVFFVISGFLITSIIYSEAKAENFSIWTFYERRIRRILPAITVVYVTVLIASFFILMPGETVQQAKYAVSSMAFVSNVYFYSFIDYFDASSETNALLHTWSLSVEEQFYIFFPPIFVWLYRSYPRHLKLIIVGVAILTLAMSQWRVASDPSAAFYLVHYRAWELMIGSILAIGAVPFSSNRVVTNVAAALGLVLIVGSVLMLYSTSIFPGISALPSCLGAGLLIWSGGNRNTFVGSLLSLKPATAIGKISYSLYLWHWPIWVLGSQVYEPKTFFDKAVYISAAIIVASASWYFVEQPFRKKQPAVSSKRVVKIGAAILASTIAFAVVTPVASSTYWQVPAKVEQVASFINYRADKDMRIGDCFLTSGFNELKLFKFDKCLDISKAKPNYLLVGDSHAAHFYPGLSNLPEINILQATASGCRPIDGTKGELRCTSLVKYITDEFLPAHHVDGIILSARWQDGDIPALERQIAKLKKYTSRIIIFGPIAEYDEALPRVLAQSLYKNDSSLIPKHLVSGKEQMDEAMNKAVISDGAEYISIYHSLCPDDVCSLWTSDGNPIQYDYSHLTAVGSNEITSRVHNLLLPKTAMASSIGG